MKTFSIFYTFTFLPTSSNQQTTNLGPFLYMFDAYFFASQFLPTLQLEESAL